MAPGAKRRSDRHGHTVRSHRQRIGGFPDAIANELSPVLIPGEAVNKCFKLVRDLFVFTDWRLILIDKQGLTGKKIEYHTIPYKFITHFSVETAGHFDLDAELKIWVSGTPVPIEKSFTKGEKITEVQKLLASVISASTVVKKEAPAPALPIPLVPPPIPTAVPLTSKSFGENERDSHAVDLFERARCFAKSGDRDSAVDALKNIIRLYPDSRFADKARRTLEKSVSSA